MILTKISFICVVILFSFPRPLEAQVREQSMDQDKWLKISLAAFTSTKKIFRGAIFYPYPTIFAGPGLTLFNHLSIRGPSIYWTKSGLDIGGRLISDRAPIIELTKKFDEKNDYRSSRSNSFEFVVRYRYGFGFRNLFFIGGEFAQETYQHKGRYLAFHFGIPVYMFLSFKSNTGWGNLSHNRYIYGDSAQAGLAHQDIMLQYAVPGFLGADIMILEIGQHFVLQEKNRSSDLIRGNSTNSQVSTVFIWNI